MDLDEITNESVIESLILSIDNCIHQNYFPFYCTLASLNGYASVLRALPTPRQICAGDPYHHIASIDAVLERRRDHTPGFLIPRFLRLRLKRTKHFLQSKCYFLEELDEVREEYQQEQLEARLADMREDEEADEQEEASRTPKTIPAEALQDEMDMETSTITNGIMIDRSSSPMALDIEDIYDYNGLRPPIHLHDLQLQHPSHSATASSSPTRSNATSPILTLKNFIQSDSVPVSPISSPPTSSWPHEARRQARVSNSIMSSPAGQRQSVISSSNTSNTLAETVEVQSATAKAVQQKQQEPRPQQQSEQQPSLEPVKPLQIQNQLPLRVQVSHPTYFQPIFVYESIILESIMHAIQSFKSASFNNLGEITNRVWTEAFKTWERIRIVTNNETGDVQTLKDWYHHKLHVFRIIHYGRTVPGWHWISEEYRLHATEGQVAKFAKKKQYRRQAFQPFPLGPRFEELAALFPSNSKYNPLAYSRRYYNYAQDSIAPEATEPEAAALENALKIQQKTSVPATYDTRLATIPEPASEASQSSSRADLTSPVQEDLQMSTSPTQDTTEQEQEELPAKELESSSDLGSHDPTSTQLPQTKPQVQPEATTYSLDYYGIDLSDDDKRAAAGVQLDFEKEDEADDEGEGDEYGDEEVYSEPESIRPAPYANLDQGKPAPPAISTDISTTRNSSVSSPTAATSSATAHSQSGVSAMSRTNATHTSLSTANSVSTNAPSTNATSISNEANEIVKKPLLTGVAEREDTISPEPTVTTAPVNPPSAPSEQLLPPITPRAAPTAAAASAEAAPPLQPKPSLASLDVMSRRFKLPAAGNSKFYLKYPYISALTFFDDVVREHGNASDAELSAIHHYIVKSPHVMLIIFDSYRDVNALLLVAQTILRLEQTWGGHGGAPYAAAHATAAPPRSRQDSVMGEETYESGAAADSRVLNLTRVLEEDEEDLVMVDDTDADAQKFQPEIAPQRAEPQSPIAPARSATAWVPRPLDADDPLFEEDEGAGSDAGDADRAWRLAQARSYSASGLPRHARSPLYGVGDAHVSSSAQLLTSLLEGPGSATPQQRLRSPGALSLAADADTGFVFSPLASPSYANGSGHFSSHSNSSGSNMATGGSAHHLRGHGPRVGTPFDDLHFDTDAADAAGSAAELGPGGGATRMRPMPGFLSAAATGPLYGGSYANKSSSSMEDASKRATTPRRPTSPDA